MPEFDRYNAARDLLVRPVVSEKSYALLDENKYTFIVHKDANKTQIRQAVELLFDVEVTGVNTINRKGKRKRTRAGFGKRPDTRRAIVSVDPNPRDASKKSRIDIFGGPVS
ncbi:50S ribosomal protein L23 [Actinocrinis puniceicyclus]|uniref:Large ribosomal subunit protein uL23 n=1 Tax=Actinocrinis puniceicyclus TaxID=977794 RepID=A0A8J8BBW7_9ACTN|nr:50S ribosomal protein L23 [Actinocrinis puniceicyclus]MBS2964492.1 50S ribosomal protein L23 [Actinocrinis puniceicyclus]